MVEDSESPREVQSMHREFDLLPDLKPEYGGVVDSLSEATVDNDAYDDDELRYKLMNNIVPSVDTITR
jgi:hypothetical protein